jgi:hypothetical protein
MNIELTEEQSKAIEQTRDQPPCVTDPRTHKTYVLVGADLFERMKSLVGDGYALSDTYRAQMDSAMKAGWNDPAMNDYNNYDAHRKS